MHVDFLWIWPYAANQCTITWMFSNEWNVLLTWLCQAWGHDILAPRLFHSLRAQPSRQAIWLHSAFPAQSLATDMRRLFLFNVATVVLPILRKKFFLIGEESDDCHRIKRALYIGIKRLWFPVTNSIQLLKTCDKIMAVQGTFNDLWKKCHYSDVIMSAMLSQITGVSIVYSTVCSCADQRKHQSFASLAFVREIHRWLVNSPHKEPVTRKMFPLDDVIM